VTICNDPFMKPLHCLPLVFCLACEPATGSGSAEPPTPSAPEQKAAPSPAPASSDPAPPLSLTPYPWHADPSIEALAATDSLRQRFAPPDGFTRVSLRASSFGQWLRHLPLAAPGTPVRSYTGARHLPADHPNIAAVTTLDVGSRDLQQCADAIMRLHAEWLWQGGQADQASYPSGAGPIPWKRYVSGGYPAPSGNTFVWKRRSSPRKNDHATYRKYADAVASWANTVALAQQTKVVQRADLRPGDFFVLAGNPGHSVLVLDVAENADGERIALLGQSFMPAQSFQILRPSPDGVWFSLEEDDGVKTPFWPRFPWTSVRRLD
jgi:hypothetical protein